MPNKKHKTAASSSRARQQGRQAEPGESHGDVTPSTKGATGCELGVPPRSVDGRNGGTLTPYPPGSNGDVHRGPDTGLRRNVMRAIIMGALADQGLSLEDLTASLDTQRGEDGQLPHRPVYTLIPMAMVHHLKAGLQNIAKAAARGDPNAYGPLLRLVEGAHTILQPLRDESAQGHTPKPARFLYTEQLEDQAIAAAAPDLAPGQVTDADGKVYE